MIYIYIYVYIRISELNLSDEYMKKNVKTEERYVLDDLFYLSKSKRIIKIKQFMKHVLFFHFYILSLSLSHTHTHTHTHIYIYIYIFISLLVSFNDMSAFVGYSIIGWFLLMSCKHL